MLPNDKKSWAFLLSHTWIFPISIFNTNTIRNKWFLLLHDVFKTKDLSHLLCWSHQDIRNVDVLGCCQDELDLFGNVFCVQWFADRTQHLFRQAWMILEHLRNELGIDQTRTDLSHANMAIAMGSNLRDWDWLREKPCQVLKGHDTSCLQPSNKAVTAYFVAE